MRPTRVIQAANLFGEDLSGYGRRLLAEGDSWFTIGALNLGQASNLLLEQDFTTRSVIVSCAYPGDTLQQMAKGVRDRDFDRLLRQPRFQRYWEAILLSAGGNDLIDAAQHRAVKADGSPAKVDERVLLTPAEAAVVNPGVSGPARFLSNPGWAKLAGYLNQCLADLVARRDQGISQGRPLILHTYSAPTVRPSGTVGASKGWLYPAMLDYGIPEADWQGVAGALFERLRQLWLQAAQTLPQVHVFDSASLVPLVPAAPGSGGVSGDWVNEIHLTPGGYQKLGARMGPWIEQLLGQYP
jgi:lysophospholipase L1-like esterase